MRKVIAIAGAPDLSAPMVAAAVTALDPVAPIADVPRLAVGGRIDRASLIGGTLVDPETRAEIPTWQLVSENGDGTWTVEVPEPPAVQT